MHTREYFPKQIYGNILSFEKKTKYIEGKKKKEVREKRGIVFFAAVFFLPRIEHQILWRFVFY